MRGLGAGIDVRKRKRLNNRDGQRVGHATTGCRPVSLADDLLSACLPGTRDPKPKPDEGLLIHRPDQGLLIHKPDEGLLIHKTDEGLLIHKTPQTPRPI